ncbi:hypothetical protein BDV59DRAFT_200849 [Aspergillus ambiguus]|uniref:uncharacterized protein n=1 Tax=Aspergillus ambiguus TaxID=176160 RepID=UPI003CCCB2FE
MRIMTLLALAALATAVPTGPGGSSSSSSTAAVASLTPEEQAKLDQAVEQSAKENSDPTKCPVTHKYQACCRSLSGIGDAIFRPIGKLLPPLKGANLASPVSFSCERMKDGEAPEHCEDQASCCATDPKTGTTDINSCLDYRETVNKSMEALQRSHNRHSAREAVALPVDW